MSSRRDWRLDLPAYHVLRPLRECHDRGFPATPHLILPPRITGRIAVIALGSRPSRPKWMSVLLITRWVDDGKLSVDEAAIPHQATLMPEDMTPALLNDWRERVEAMKPLLDLREGAYREQGALVVYPDEFGRIVKWYAGICGRSHLYVATSVWRWLKNGRTESALVGSFGNCGVAPNGRSFERGVVGGPKVHYGEDYVTFDAQPYTRDQRAKLRALVKPLLDSPENTGDQYDLLFLVRTKAAAESLPPPSFEQLKHILRSFDRRRREKDSVGQAHVRYGRVWYATQEAEADSTKLQVFTDSELAGDVKFKNPTMYLYIDVNENYIAACLVSLDPPSNELFAELLYRAYGGMKDVCIDLGLRRIGEAWVPTRPGPALWVDNQELTSPRLNEALLTHLDCGVHFAKVGKGDDKGMVEGRIGNVKSRVWRLPQAFPKGSVGRVLDRARSHANGDVRAMEQFVIEECHDLNHKELPPEKIPKGFPVGERPANTREVFLWNMELHREAVRPLPDKDAIARICLPTMPYPVHADRGIYINGRYYLCDLLRADGLLKRHVKGETPVVTVARHRGTSKFVYWVRGKGQFIKCELSESQVAIFGEMTVAESDAHMKSLPPVGKRELLRRMRKAAAAQSEHTSHASAQEASKAAKTGHVTRDMERTAAVRKHERALGQKREAHRRFPEHVPDPDASPLPTTADVHEDSFDGEHMRRVARLLRGRESGTENTEK